MTGRDQVGSVLALYGSRTNALVYNTNKDCVDEVTLQNVGEETYSWILSNKNLRIKTQGKYFSAGNAKSIVENEGYRECI